MSIVDEDIPEVNGGFAYDNQGRSGLNPPALAAFRLESST
jgi:hypothetical protein